jgi:hypothetical protein
LGGRRGSRRSSDIPEFIPDIAVSLLVELDNLHYSLRILLLL